jgi:hypothetical protein
MLVFAYNGERKRIFQYSRRDEKAAEIPISQVITKTEYREHLRKNVARWILLFRRYVNIICTFTRLGSLTYISWNHWYKIMVSA